MSEHLAAAVAAHVAHLADIRAQSEAEAAGRRKVAAAAAARSEAARVSAAGLADIRTPTTERSDHDT